MSNKKFEYVEQLIGYGIENGMLSELDVEMVRNALWKRLHIEESIDLVIRHRKQTEDIYSLLNQLTIEMKESGEPLDYSYQEEMFQSEIMGLLMPRNSEVNHIFWSLHRAKTHFATEYFYNLSNASTYIRMDRVAKNVSWRCPSDFGELDITINLSKPEKDPKEIALAKTLGSSVYPKCLLCVDNVGYPGNISHPARSNHRIIEMTLDNEPWYMQYSPYVYYTEHAIVLCRDHRDMKITRNTFIRLCDFVDLVPHYFIGSNADLHTVGGSILTHDHYQAGNYEMPMMRANIVDVIKPSTDDDLRMEVLEWPLSVVRLVSDDREKIINWSAYLLKSWINYSDEQYDLIAHTNERHNTITPILRKVGNTYEMYLALRNNRKNEMHPDGIFHPHTEHHHIKKENIGLIEVMGLAVLPARLDAEIKACIEEIMKQKQEVCFDAHKIEAQPQLLKHVPWLVDLTPEIEVLLFQKEATDATVKVELEAFFKREVGRKFEFALKDAGIFKTSYEGISQFLRFSEEGYHAC